MTSPSPHHDPNYARLDQRVTGLEKGIFDMGESLKEISSKLDERGRTPWGVLISAAVLLVAVLGIIGTAWKDPIERIIGRQEADLRIIEGAVVPRVEHEYHWSILSTTDDEIKARLERLEAPYFKGAGE